MKDSQMQRLMPSKPALIVEITLQQVNMTNVQCQDLVTTTNVPSMQNQYHWGYPIYVLKRTTRQEQSVKRTRVGISPWLFNKAHTHSMSHQSSIFNQVKHQLNTITYMYDRLGMLPKLKQLLFPLSKLKIQFKSHNREQHHHLLREH